MSYTYRLARFDDFHGFFELYRTETIEYFGGFASTEEDIRSEWDAPGFSPEEMVLLAFVAGTEAPIGYIELRAFHDPPVRIYSYGYVHPDHRGRGVGTELLRRAAELAPIYYPRIPEHARVVLQAFSPKDEGRRLLESCGYTTTRESLIMEIGLADRPPRPEFPHGFALRSMADGLSLEDLVAVKEIAFRDHRGSVDETLESAVATWRHMIESNRRVFDPTLFVALCDGEKRVGEIMMWTETEEDAHTVFVQSLGVIPEYRRRGLAEQLLYFAFTQAYERGKRAVSLSVDGSSLTGADRLYRRVGMQTVRSFTAYEKELRAGEELSNQGQR